MGELADSMAAPGEHTPAPPRRRATYPEGWQPRSDIDMASGGFIVTAPSTNTQPPDAEQVLRDEGLDPAAWVLTGFRRSRWQQHPDGEWLYAFRVQVVPASVHGAMVEDRADLVRELSDWEPRRDSGRARHSGQATYVAPVGDTQIGKDAGGGTEATVRRFLACTEQAVERYVAMRPSPPAVLLPWLGDCIEGIWSQSGALRMRLDQPPTAQVRIYRRMLALQVKAFLEVAERVDLVAIPGNHDESVRVANHMATDPADSWAVDGASAVADGLADNPATAGRFRFLYPGRDELTVTGDWSGVRVGMAHGHQFGRDPLKWWDQQAGGRTPVGDADLLLAAHLHHLRIQDHGGARLFLQIPALDGGSPWLTLKHGADAPSRTLTFVLDDGHVRELDPVI